MTFKNVVKNGFANATLCVADKLSGSTLQYISHIYKILTLHLRLMTEVYSMKQMLAESDLLNVVA